MGKTAFEGLFLANPAMEGNKLSLLSVSTEHELLSYEAWAILSETELVSLQPLGADHATLPHMKAMHVPFHLVYGSLISFKGFQSDRPKSRGMSVDPR